MNESIECVYVVCFYKQCYGPASVKIAGTYLQKDKAISRIIEIFENEIQLAKNNTIVYGRGMCGWINKNIIGDYTYFGLNINQPYHPIQII